MKQVPNCKALESYWYVFLCTNKICQPCSICLPGWKFCLAVIALATWKKESFDQYGLPCRGWGRGTRGCGSADGSALPAAIPPGSTCDAGKVAKRVSNVSLSAGIGYLPTKFAQAEPPATRSRRAATSAPPTAPASASSTGTPPGRRRGGRRDGRVRVAHRAFVWLGWKKISASLWLLIKGIK
jgi:hypothetical protein